MVKYTKHGKLVLRYLSHTELCAIDAFLGHFMEQLQREMRQSRQAQAYSPNDLGVKKKEEYNYVCQKLIRQMESQMSQLPNWLAVARDDSGKAGA